jgi:hypothetical protein
MNIPDIIDGNGRMENEMHLPWHGLETDLSSVVVEVGIRDELDTGHDVVEEGYGGSDSDSATAGGRRELERKGDEVAHVIGALFPSPNSRRQEMSSVWTRSTTLRSTCRRKCISTM